MGSMTMMTLPGLTFHSVNLRGETSVGSHLLHVHLLLDVRQVRVLLDLHYLAVHHVEFGEATFCEGRALLDGFHHLRSDDRLLGTNRGAFATYATGTVVRAVRSLTTSEVQGQVLVAFTKLIFRVFHGYHLTWSAHHAAEDLPFAMLRRCRALKLLRFAFIRSDSPF